MRILIGQLSDIAATETRNVVPLVELVLAGSNLYSFLPEAGTSLTFRSVSSSSMSFFGCSEQVNSSS